MTDDAPTLPLPGISPAPQPGPPAPRRRGVIAVFVILSALVVAAIVVLVVVVASRGSITPPSALATPSTSPTASAPPAPTATAPPAPAPTFTSLRSDALQQDCFRAGPGHDRNGPGKHGPGKHDGDTANPSIRVSWQTADASEVWIAQGPGDAAAAQGVQLPSSGNEGDFPSPVTYDCTKRSETFTMTLVGADGQHTSRSWTVQNPRRSVF